MSNGSIHLYLDANIFIDLVEGQSDAATNLIQLAKQRKWVYVISAFTVMEAIDIKQEHKFFHNKLALGMPIKYIIAKRRERDLSESDLKEVNDHLKRKSKVYGLDTVIYINESRDWKLALNITNETNISSSDAIHLATAIMGGCHVLVTNDDFFIGESNEYLIKNKLYNQLRASRPENVEKNLKELNLI